jgi:hypothetical protein
MRNAMGLTSTLRLAARGLPVPGTAHRDPPGRLRPGLQSGAGSAESLDIARDGEPVEPLATKPSPGSRDRERPPEPA